MSTTHELPQPVADSTEPGTPTPTDGGRWSLDRVPTAARWGVAAVAVAVIGAGVAVAVTGHGSSAPTAGDAIELPSAVGGLSALPATADVTRTAGWQVKATAAGHGATVTGRSYGTGKPGARSIRIVAGRTDLTGALELTWAAGTAETVGQDRCTDDLRLTAASTPRVRPTVMLCWRTSATFSAYSLIIDPKATTPITAAEGAAALDGAWTIASAQR